MKKMKSLFRSATLLLFVCILLLSPLMQIKAQAYCIYAVDDAMAWLEKQVGKTIGDGQCVQLTKAYYTYLGVANPTGNGSDYATNTLPSGWKRIKGATPQKGDIMVWTEGLKGWGHVAICGGPKIYYHQRWRTKNDIGYVSKETSAYTSGFTVKDKEGNTYRANYWGVIRPDYPEKTIATDVPAPVDNSVPNGKYMIKSAANTSYYMNVYAGTDKNGTKVVTWTIDKKTDDQHFKFVHQGNGAYYVYGVGLTNRVLDIYYGSNNKLDIGDYLQVWAKGSADAKSSVFNVVPVGDNKFVFELKSKNNAVLGITSAANNKNITLQTYTASSKQHWYICDYNGKILTTCDLHGHKISEGACTVCGEVFLAVTAQPVSLKVKSGTDAKFSVEAAGNNMTYQWQYSIDFGKTWKNTTLTGAQTATLSVPATTGRSGYWYRCIVSDADGNKVCSNAASLYVLGIKTQPTSIATKVGNTATFTVSATGHDKTYQWQWRANSSSSWASTTVSGNKTATISVPATTARNGYQYRCKITDSAGNVIYSNAVTLNVLGIKTQPVSVATKSGNTATFKVAATGKGITYQWQWRANSSSSWANTTVSGNKTATISMPATTTRDGYQYRCKITDSAGNVIYSNAVTLNVLGIKTQPASVTAKVGDTVTFKVVATGKGITYQWQWRNGSSGTWARTTVSGNKTATISMPATAARNGYQYRCKITDSAGNVVYSYAVVLNVK